MSEPLLSVRGLRTYFPSYAGVIKAVDGVDFDVYPGETVCVVGESGCGKSVTALSILRLIRWPGKILPSSRIRFRDQDLLAMSDSDLRSLRGNEIAMIFQDPLTSLNPVFQVGEQIAEAVRLHQGLPHDQAAERAVEMLRLVGIPEAKKRSKAYPHQLSGGQRQRVMIAMALSCNPALLIADEPTTALDVTIQAQILELMKDLRRRLNTSVLLITHDLGVVAEMADRVIVMYGGQVVEHGTADAIFRSPQHPYTEALLNATPVLGMDRSTRLRVVRGTVPAARDWPPGCRFQPRCDVSLERCSVEAPPTVQAAGSSVACWQCVDGPRDTHREWVEIS